MAITIETAADAVAFFSRFPPDTRVVKAESFANCYTQIFINGPSAYTMVQTDVIVVESAIETESTLIHFKDCPEGTDGSFSAIVL